MVFVRELRVRLSAGAALQQPEHLLELGGGKERAPLLHHHLSRHFLRLLLPPRRLLAVLVVERVALRVGRGEVRREVREARAAAVGRYQRVHLPNGAGSRPAARVGAARRRGGGGGRAGDARRATGVGPDSAECDDAPGSS